MFYVYDSHFGEAYISEVRLSDKELYCKKCDDQDCLLKIYETRKEAESFIKEYSLRYT